MGDSDEEYDRRRVRDKFKRERSDYQDRHAGGRRDDWSDRDSGTGTWGGSSTGNRDRMSGGGRSGQRGDYSRDYGSGQRRDRYGSPGDRSDMSPPAKRGRGGRDWDERGNYSQSGNYDYNHPNSAWGSIESALQHSGNNSTSNTTHHQGSGMTQPAMQTFKQFLASQPDTVDDTEAVCKYNEYKTKFRKDQIENFFKAHKDEEWFRSRYHPDEFGNRKEEQQAALKNRLNVFMDLLDKGWIDSVSIDVEKSDQIIRLLDAAVIKLEGGTDFDLLSLDEKTEVEKREPDLSLFSVDVEMPKKDEKEDKEDKEDKEEGEGEGEVEGESEEKKVSESDEGTEKIKSNENAENAEEGEEESKDETISEEKVEEDADQGEMKEEEKTEPKEEGEEMEEGEEGEDSSTTEDKPDMKPTSSSADDSTANEAKSEEPKPRPLHKKDSIFLRNIAPNITKAEIEEMCKKYPGFLRVALADPAPDRKFYRRGWVTFEKLGKIREICWQMTTTKLKDCELGAIVNRDLTRRIRSVNGIASHKNVVRTDIRNAAKVIFNLDKQRNLWEDDNSEDKNEASDQIPSYGLKSRNPLLKNIAEYMIEEANAEEEELLGEDAGEIDAEETAVNQSLERDESVIKVLDRLLLYLRIVHSVDYYNHSDYPSEDEMPNRIGIMHARGAPPSSKVTNQEVNEYIKAFEAKIKPFLQPLPVITEEEAQKLGKKDPDVEVENFIQENTQELSKDKWLCPLSGKKFKGPDFVRKHIENKHMDRLNEVRRDCAYFNNYIMDPKRPQLPEHPSNRTSAPQQQNRNENQNTNGNTPSGLPWAYPGPLHLNPYMRNGPPIPFPNPMAAWTGLTRGYPLGPMPMDYGRLAAGANRGRFNPRQKQRTYRDLDAPDDE